MHLRLFAIVLLLAGLEGPPAVEAQPVDRIARVGYLSLNLAAGDPRGREAFLQGLRDLGHVEGRNLLIEYRSAEGKPERFPALAAELVALKVDVIVTAAGTAAALAAKQATSTVPIVFAAVGDPVGEGLIDSLAQPGGNVSGLSVLSPELMGKSLELLKQAVAGKSRMAMLWNPDSIPERFRRERLEHAEVAARTLGVRLQIVEARGPNDFGRAFSEITKARADALYVLATPVFDVERRRLLDLVAKHRLPTVYSFKGWAEEGGLMSYGPDIVDLFRRAAIYVDKILKGGRPGDLPVAQPTKFELVINLKTAKALGLAIPASLRARADHVIE